MLRKLYAILSPAQAFHKRIHRRWKREKERRQMKIKSRALARVDCVIDLYVCVYIRAGLPNWPTLLLSQFTRCFPTFLFFYSAGKSRLCLSPYRTLLAVERGLDHSIFLFRKIRNWQRVAF